MSVLGSVAERILGVSGMEVAALEKASVEARDEVRSNQLNLILAARDTWWDVAVLVERLKIEEGDMYTSVSVYDGQKHSTQKKRRLST